ncbi:MAG TPA: hypothetical protein VGQ95_13280 [Chthoniobacterales bacterium]|nr:hypothetical protein [Chthoniobacterales bacterium]
MTALVLLLCLFVAATGVLAIFAPARANDLARLFSNRPGLYTATAIRLVLGAGLLFVAEDSRAPLALRIFGAIILFVGVLMPLLGLDRHRRMINWWLSVGRPIQLVWGGFALAFGIFLIYAIA